MRSANRGTAFGSSVLALSLIVSAVGAQQRPGTERPQRGGAPNPDTPQILVSAFASPTQKLGVEVANELRSRIQDEHNAKELYAVTKTNIDRALVASGFPVDTALTGNDLLELAKVTRGEYIVDGKVDKTGNRVRADIRILTKTGKETLIQPLPAVEGNDAEEIAKAVERHITNALKSMPPYKLCISDLRAEKWEQAIKNGDAALAIYENSVLARICLLQAFDRLNMTDSVIVTANAILAKDSTNRLALVNLADAHEKKGDKAKAIDIHVRIASLEPTNDAIAAPTAEKILQLGASEKALSIFETLITANPDNATFIRRKWAILRNLKQWKQAIDAGEQLAKMNPAVLDSVDFHNLQVGAAQSDSNPARIVELAKRASERFPKDVSFPNIVSQNERKLGHLDKALEAAKRAIELEPNNTNAVLLAAFTAKDLNQLDTAAAIASRGMAAGADRAKLEPFVLGPVKALIDKAQASSERADWEAALAASQKLDAASRSPATQYFVGASSFQIGFIALRSANELGQVTGKDAKDARAKACAEVKVVEDMWAIAQVSVPAGGRFSPDGAAQIMTLLQQYGEYPPQMKTRYCTGR